MSSFQKRVVSGTLALLVLGAILYVKSFVFDMAIIFIGIIAGYEYFKAFINKNHKPDVSIILSYIITFILFAIFMARNSVTGKNINSIIPILYFSILSIFTLVVLFIPLAKKMNITDMMINLLSLFYIAIPLGMIAFLSKLNNGFYLIYLIFIISFASDTFAFFTGKTIGKHKLAPKMSPNKTKEGSIGGIIGTIIVLIILRILNFYSLDYVYIVILGIFGSSLAQIGDLTASIIKRYTGIKDFGNIMPGHGGILDRLDSIIFVTPLVFLLNLISLLIDNFRIF